MKKYLNLGGGRRCVRCRQSGYRPPGITDRSFGRWSAFRPRFRPGKRENRFPFSARLSQPKNNFLKNPSSKTLRRKKTAKKAVGEKIFGTKKRKWLRCANDPVLQKRQFLLGNSKKKKVVGQRMSWTKHPVADAVFLDLLTQKKSPKSEKKFNALDKSKRSP